MAALMPTRRRNTSRYARGRRPFVFAEFSGGGGDSAVSIYEWLNGSLHLLAAKTSGRSATATTASARRRTTRRFPPPGRTATIRAGSADGQILEGGFVEGGINLTSIYEGLGKELPCVNRFLAQTGSSHPDTGVLEDFAAVPSTSARS